jgi:hypothetical protein
MFNVRYKNYTDQTPSGDISMNMEWKPFVATDGYDQNKYYMVWSDNSFSLHRGTSDVQEKNIICEGDVYIAEVTCPQVHRFPLAAGC